MKLSNMVLGAVLATMTALPLTGSEAKTAAASKWTTIAVLPWGEGPGKLEQQIKTTDARQVYRGPTRFLAFDGGKIAVLDVLGSAVEEYDSGKHSRELKFPANDDKDAETLCIDMAATKPGEYWLLSLGQRAILRVEKDGAVKPYKLEGLTKDSLLMSMTMDGKGNLYALDGYDNGVLRLKADGTALPRVKDDTAQPMTCDEQGRFYNFRLVGKDNAKTYELVRWSPGSEPEAIGKVSSDLEMNQLDVFGVDKAGNIYGYICSGAIENPSRVEVVRWSPEGTETGRVAAPPDPFELTFVHGKAVSPDGTVYAVAVTREGLALMRLEGF